MRSTARCKCQVGLIIMIVALIFTCNPPILQINDRMLSVLIIFKFPRGGSLHPYASQTVFFITNKLDSWGGNIVGVIFLKQEMVVLLTEDGLTEFDDCLES